MAYTNIFQRLKLKGWTLGVAACFSWETRMYTYVYTDGWARALVVEAACLKSRRSRVRTPLWPLNFKKQNLSSRAVVRIQYCGEPPWPRENEMKWALDHLCAHIG